MDITFCLENIELQEVALFNIKVNSVPIFVPWSRSFLVFSCFTMNKIMFNNLYDMMCIINWCFIFNIYQSLPDFRQYHQCQGVAEGTAEDHFPRPQICCADQCPASGGHSLRIHTPSPGSVYKVCRLYYSLKRCNLWKK